MGTLYKKDVKGAVHNHCSDYSSDATESFDSMVESAKKAGLDFIIFTDHNSVDLKKNQRDKNYGGLQVIAGTEITPECKFVRFEDKELIEDESNGHLLVFDLDELPDDELIKKGICQDMIDFVAGKGLVCFVAHPDHKGAKAFGVPSYRCRNFDITGDVGFSLWDIMTDWQNSAKSVTSGLIGIFFPSLVLKGPEKETLSRWDALARERSCPIIGEIDQHAYRYKYYGIKFTIFKSRFAFKTIRTHIVFKEPLDIYSDFRADALDALGKGHAYVSLDYFKDASGFTFEAETSSKRYIMGDTIKGASEEVRFSVKTPGKARIRVMKNGNTLHKITGDAFSFSTKEKGAYRVEAYRKSFFKFRPWIFSNTITNL